MKLRRNEFCPIHRSLFCCGREQARKERRFQLGVQRIEDPHHPRGYRELRSPAEMRKLLNRKIVEQDGKCAICHQEFDGLQRHRALCRYRHKAQNADFQNMPTRSVLISGRERIMISRSA